jgi:hypothetical protein
VLKGGKIGQDKECCCVVGCNDIFATSGGVGTTTDTYQFPTTREALVFEYDAYSVPDAFTVKFCGNTVVDTGSVSGNGRICLNKPAGCTEVEVTVVGPEGTAWTYTIKCEACPPPPPPEPCCTKIAVCEDTQIGVFKCGGESEYRCCTSNRADDGASQSQCSGNNPPTTVCEPNGVSPSLYAPYDCLGMNFAGGAWVRVSGWKAYLGNYEDLSEDDIVRFTLLDSVMNGSFFVPMTCLSVGARKTFTFTRGATDFCTATWFVAVAVDLCSQTVSVSASNEGCIDGAGAFNQGSARTMYPIPCNLFLGCYCQGWSGNVMEYDFSIGQYVVNGTIAVFSA